MQLRLEVHKKTPGLDLWTFKRNDYLNLKILLKTMQRVQTITSAPRPLSDFRTVTELVKCRVFKLDDTTSTEYDKKMELAMEICQA